MKSAKRSETDTPSRERSETSSSRTRKTPSQRLPKPLATFLNAHRDPNSQSPSTNTRIPLKDIEFSGGSWVIPDEDYDEFLQLYYQEVLMRGQVDRLTERHRTDDEGPMLIDLDFQYPHETENRYIDDEAMDKLVNEFLDELSMTYDMDEDTKFTVFILRKPDMVPTATYVKDGVHILITLQAGKIEQRTFRNRMIPRLASAFETIPFENSWDNIYDEGMADGDAPWPLYGCRKPPTTNAPYLITHQIEVTVNSDGLEKEEKDDFKDKDFLKNNLHLLSARNTRDLLRLQRSVTFTNECSALIDNDEDKERAAKAARSLANSESGGVNLTPLSYNVDRMIHLLYECETVDEIEAHYQDFLKAIDMDDHQLSEAAQFVMVLGADHYEAGSYLKRSKVCWLLKSISEKLLVVWIRFMFRREKVDMSRMNEWITLWTKINNKGSRQKCFYALKNLANENNPEAYAAIVGESIEHYLMATIQHALTTSKPGRGNSKSIMGATDSDIAKLCSVIYDGSFVCVELEKEGVWLEFLDHRWQYVKQGTTLRCNLSDKVRPLYMRKALMLNMEVANLAPDDPYAKSMTARRDHIMKIVEDLGGTTRKEKIMKECKHLFYDKNFLKSLDSQESYTLVCVKNGVVDLVTGEFRPGKPTDMISMCTNVNYIGDIDSEENQRIKAEIELYMSKMFTDPEVCETMWEILSTVLHGDVKLNQRLYFLHGDGQNGKGIFIEQLLPNLFGDYYCTLQRNFYLNEAEAVGGTNTEVADLIGKRICSTSEFSENATMREAPFKQLIGGTDEMKGRRLFSSTYVKFFPQVTAFIGSNNFIDIKARDHGVWRRIAVILCKSFFLDNPDKNNKYHFKRENISEKMKTWYEVFQHLLLKRVVKNKGKVHMCKAIIDASLEYRASQDEIAQFVHDMVVEDETGILGVVELNRKFKEWFDDIKGTKYKGKIDKLHTYIDRYFDKPMDKARKEWTGIRIRSADEGAHMAPAVSSNFTLNEGDREEYTMHKTTKRSRDTDGESSSSNTPKRARTMNVCDDYQPMVQSSTASSSSKSVPPVMIVKRKRFMVENSDESNKENEHVNKKNG